MKAVKDFIVHIEEPFKKSVQTASGLDLQLDRRFSPTMTANVEVTVVEEPLDNKTPIKKGQKIFIDPTIVFRQAYEKTGEHRSQYEVAENTYRVPQNLVIMYYNKEWKCIADNNLTEPVMEEINNPLLINQKVDPNKAKIAFTNPDSEVEPGEVVHTTGLFAEVYFQNKKYLWYRNRHIIAK
jgi:hypothetical protein